MNKALEDLQAGRGEPAPKVTAHKDPASSRRAANLSLGLPILALAVASVANYLRKNKPGPDSQILLMGAAIAALLLLLTGLVLALTAFRARNVDYSERPIVRPILGLLGNIGLLGVFIFGGVSGFHQGISNALAARNIQAAAREAKDELRKSAEENRPPSPDQTAKNIQRMTSALAPVSENGNSANAALARASKAYLLKMQPVATNYAAAAKAVMQSPILDMSNVSGVEQLRAKKQLLRDFLRANDALEAFTTNRLELYRQELQRASVPAAEVDKALTAYEEISPDKDDLARRIRADDRVLGQSFLGMLDILENNFGKWKYNLERRKVMFEDDATLDKYVTLREQAEYAGKEQQRLQAKLLATASE